MTQAELNNLIRLTLAAFLGGLVTKGFLTPEQLEAIVTYVLGLGGLAVVAVWAVVSNRLKALLEQVAKAPEVEKIVVESPALANSITSEKVVSP